MNVPSGTNTFAVSLVTEKVLWRNCDRACAPWAATSSSQRAANASDNLLSVSSRSEKSISFSILAQDLLPCVRRSPDWQPKSARPKPMTAHAETAVRIAHWTESDIPVFCLPQSPLNRAGSLLERRERNQAGDVRQME